MHMGLTKNHESLGTYVLSIEHTLQGTTLLSPIWIYQSLLGYNLA